MGYEPEQLAQHFESVVLLGRSRCRYCMGWRQNLPIAIARKPQQSLERIWSKLRHYGYSPRKLYLLEKGEPTETREEAESES